MTSTGACSSLKPYLVSLSGNTAWVIRYLLLLHSKALKDDSLLQKPMAFNAIAERRCDYKVRLESSFLTKLLLNKVCFIFFLIEYLPFSLVNYIYIYKGFLGKSVSVFHPDGSTQDFCKLRITQSSLGKK